MAWERIAKKAEEDLRKSRSDLKQAHIRVRQLLSVLTRLNTHLEFSSNISASENFSVALGYGPTKIQQLNKLWLDADHVLRTTKEGVEEEMAG